MKIFFDFDLESWFLSFAQKKIEKKYSLSGGSALRTPRFAIVKSKNLLEMVEIYKKTIKKCKKKNLSHQKFSSSFLCKTNLTLTKFDFQ